nr:hypothetical protein [Tanacetum cinerariifolium]
LSVTPPSPDYIRGLEEPQTQPALQDEDEHELMFIQPHDPDFVPVPVYPEYIPLEDEHILLAEEQPLPLIVSPTAESLGYITKSDPEEDLEEYEEDETKDGLAPVALPSPPLPPSLYLSPPVDRKHDIPESEQPPLKRLCLSTLGSRYKVGESSTRGRGVDYGFTDTV